MIGSAETTLGFFCGTKSSPGWDAFTSIVSSQPNITVILETDGSITDIGFLANYKIGRCKFSRIEVNKIRKKIILRNLKHLLCIVGVDGLECSSNPCQNGGTCQEGELSYTCQCREFTIGDHCEGTQFTYSCVMIFPGALLLNTRTILPW